MSTALDIDVSSLTELDFPVPCGHSQHFAAEGPNHDDGPATHVAIAFHDCRDEGGPAVYPCCTKWADHVMAQTAKGSKMICTRCGTLDYLSEMVAIIGVLD